MSPQGIVKTIGVPSTKFCRVRPFNTLGVCSRHRALTVLICMFYAMRPALNRWVHILRVGKECHSLGSWRLRLLLPLHEHGGNLIVWL